MLRKSTRLIDAEVRGIMHAAYGNGYTREWFQYSGDSGRYSIHFDIDSLCTISIYELPGGACNLTGHSGESIKVSTPRQAAQAAARLIAQAWPVYGAALTGDYCPMRPDRIGYASCLSNSERRDYPGTPLEYRVPDVWAGRAVNRI